MRSLTIICFGLLLGGKLTTLSTKSKCNLVYHTNLCTILFKILFFGELFSSFYQFMIILLSNGIQALYFALLVKVFVKAEGAKINIL